MTVMTSDLLSSSLVVARSIFNDVFEAEVNQSSWLPLVLDNRAQKTPGKESGQYGWLSQVPLMSRWGGELELGDMVGRDFTLVNRLHTAAFAVDRLALERDSTNQIAPKSAQLADEASRFIGEEIFGLVINGGSISLDSPTFDGAAFFGSSRTIGDSATIDNALTTAGTSVANKKTNLKEANAAMMSYQTDRGKPWNRGVNLIMYHPNQSDVWYEAVSIGGGSTVSNVPTVNESGIAVWKSPKGHTMIENAYLTDDEADYFFHVSRGRAPFLYQEEFAPQLESITDPKSTEAVFHERFVYKVRGSFAVGYGDPRCAIITT